jgi:ATP-dependent DNA helicase
MREPKVEKAALLDTLKVEDTADEFQDAPSSLPIDLEAKNGDAALITEVMAKEEEELCQARVKAEEEEEARRREEAARQAVDPKARFNKLDELLTQTQLYSEFLLEKMDQITDVHVRLSPTVFFF